MEPALKHKPVLFIFESSCTATVFNGRLPICTGNSLLAICQNMKLNITTGPKELLLFSSLFQPCCFWHQL